MGLLSDNERDVIRLRHVEDVPEAEVAEMLGLTVRRVRQIAAAAVAKLRAEVVPETAN